MSACRRQPPDKEFGTRPPPWRSALAARRTGRTFSPARRGHVTHESLTTVAGAPCPARAELRPFFRPARGTVKRRHQSSRALRTPGTPTWLIEWPFGLHLGRNRPQRPSLSLQRRHCRDSLVLALVRDKLAAPSAEVRSVEEAIGAKLPTMGARSEIESSSRLRSRGGILYMSTPSAARRP